MPHRQKRQHWRDIPASDRHARVQTANPANLGLQDDWNEQRRVIEGLAK